MENEIQVNIKSIAISQKKRVIIVIYWILKIVDFSAEVEVIQVARKWLVLFQ
jgi:hypothetical protein